MRRHPLTIHWFHFHYILLITDSTMAESNILKLKKKKKKDLENVSLNPFMLYYGSRPREVKEFTKVTKFLNRIRLQAFQVFLLTIPPILKVYT